MNNSIILYGTRRKPGHFTRYPKIGTMNNTATSAVCFSLVPWWTSFVVTPVIFLCGISVTGLVNLSKLIYLHFHSEKIALRRRRKSRLLVEDAYIDSKHLVEDDTNVTVSWFLKFILFYETVTSKSSNIGRILNTLQISFHLISWSIYVFFTYYLLGGDFLAGICYFPNLNFVQWIDCGLNIFCGLHFLMRAMASIGQLRFWIQSTTLIDICVIPNVLLTSALIVRRQGLSFLRIYYLKEICDVVLITFGFLKINAKSKIANIAFYLVSIWMMASGCFHMAECVGDFWIYPVNYQPLTFWNSCFYMLITMSAVGYGDTTARTTFGRAVVVFYIIYGITIFVNTLPTIIFANKNHKYFTNYINRVGGKHMIVSGQFDNSTLVAFLKAFKSKRLTKTIRSLNIVIMNRQFCDQILSLYLKKFSSTIKYLVGSLIFRKDAKRVKISRAKVAVILSLPFSNKTKSDDLNNIVTAMSLKSRRVKLRTIVQLHLYSNKILLEMFSRWNKYGNDVIFCIDEMRLGLMGYNCLVPGIATLIINLMTTNKYKQSSDLWRRDYEEGMQMQMYSVQFSDDFHDLECLDVALILYKLWDVCLLAIKYINGTEPNFVSVNPMSENLKINTQSMIAIIMARDETQANKVPFYCSKCSHENSLRICDCLLKAPKNNRIAEINNKYFSENQCSSENDDCSRNFSVINSSLDTLESNFDNNVDETGSFYWSPEPLFEETCLEVCDAEQRSFSDHILLCLCGSGDGDIDLCNFMMPLRYRSLGVEYLRTIVILGNKNYFTGDNWNNIKNFPMFIIVNGSPVKYRDLRASGIFDCHSCVIVNGNDKTNINSYNQSFLCSILIKSMWSFENFKLPIMTEIKRDNFAYHLSSASSQDFDSLVSIQHTEPFARGLVFSQSILYSCIYSIYHNPDTFSFVKTLISGPHSEKVEKLFGSGVGLLPQKKSFVNQMESKSILKLLPMNESPLSSVSRLYEGTLNYEALFEWALVEKKILCLGLYRSNFGNHRYVFTHPQKSTEIYITDHVYCCVESV